MISFVRKLFAVTLMAVICNLGQASATPLGSAVRPSLDAASGMIAAVIQVRDRRSDAAIAAIAGAIIGGIIASQGGYSPYGYPYYRPYPAYRPLPPYDPAIAYCMRRYRSYDPITMTYLGYDGFRHPCP